MVTQKKYIYKILYIFTCRPKIESKDHNQKNKMALICDDLLCELFRYIPTAEIYSLCKEHPSLNIWVKRFFHDKNVLYANNDFIVAPKNNSRFVSVGKSEILVSEDDLVYGHNGLMINASPYFPEYIEDKETIEMLLCKDIWFDISYQENFARCDYGDRTFVFKIDSKQGDIISCIGKNFRIEKIINVFEEFVINSPNFHHRHRVFYKNGQVVSINIQGFVVNYIYTEVHDERQ